ncbi:hypothetical protein GA0115261_1010614 [Streptomyces sp. OspMP-M43]|nr:hypothetical protein GA0115261_1010614 [Streptomyces sp. OspMP-M43]
MTGESAIFLRRVIPAHPSERFAHSVQARVVLVRVMLHGKDLHRVQVGGGLKLLEKAGCWPFRGTAAAANQQRFVVNALSAFYA